MYQPIPRQIMISKNMSVVDSARFMAVVAAARSDAIIAVFGCQNISMSSGGSCYGNS